jgi:hypothetical protein
MSEQVKLRELWDTIEASGREPTEFHIALNPREPGWIVVKSRGTTRSYPIGVETAVLLSAEIRHGKFGT